MPLVWASVSDEGWARIGKANAKGWKQEMGPGMAKGRDSLGTKVLK
jgi:hypothetical protein